jgi:hypothetical protein
MTTSKKFGRKKFLASTVAAFSTVTLGACSGESEGGGTDDTGGTGGTATGGTATGGTATGGTATGGTATGGAGGLATGGSATGGGGAAMGGAPAGGAGGAGGMSAGGGTGGDGGGGGVTYVCMAMTNNGDHSHPLTIPSSHVARGYGDKGVPYILEDGGTGHTHTVELSSYEYIYLSAGTPIEEESSSTNGHTHNCIVMCAQASGR